MHTADRSERKVAGGFVVLASQWKLCRCEEEFWTVKKFGLFFFRDVVLGFFFLLLVFCGTTSFLFLLHMVQESLVAVGVVEGSDDDVLL